MSRLGSARIRQRFEKGHPEIEPRLEPEQVDILSALVEAHRQVPPRERSAFMVVNTFGGTSLIHPGLREWELEAPHSDLEVLVDAHLLRPRYGDRGLLAAVAVLPQALDYYDAVHKHRAHEFEPDDNSRFSDGEIRSIQDAVDRLRKQLDAVPMTPEARTSIDAKLDYISDAATRLGRFDFRMVAFTMLWDVAVQAAFNPTQAYGLIESVLGAARGLLPGG